GETGWYWNRESSAGCSSFISMLHQSSSVPLASGLTVEVNLTTVRSPFRAGTRYTRRGGDAEGWVANEATTRLQARIVGPGGGDPPGDELSFFTTRGSIPLVWSSPMTVGKYNPKVRLSPDVRGNGDACYRHFRRLERRWGGVAVVNLVDKGGSGQGRLGEAFRITTAACKRWGANVGWGWWDFHEITREMGYDEGVERI
ncbi:hypothetical protein TrRE_jg86, partial [Triparma retinervis]